MGTRVRFAKWMMILFLPVSQVAAGFDLRQHMSGYSSVEDALEQLPESIFTKALMVHKSRSLQESSPEFPRIIFYDEDEIVAFTDDPGSARHHSIEMIQFDDQEKKFNFFELEYDPQGIALPEVERNPAKCQQCHTYALRPNFESYFFWPGFLGAADDNARLVPHFVPVAQEVEFHDAFVQTIVDQRQQGNGRYRFVSTRDPFTGSSALKERNNLLFLEYLGELNVKRLEEILGDARYRPYRWAIRAVNVCREELDRQSFSFNEFFRRLAGRYAARVDDTYRVIAADENWRIELGAERRFDFHRGIVGQLSANNRLDPLRRGWPYTLGIFGRGYSRFPLTRLVMGYLAGIDLSHWSLSSFVRDHVFLSQVVWSAVPTRLFSEQDLQRMRSMEDHCRETLIEHEKVYRENPEVLWPFAEMGRQNLRVFQPCVGCHNQPDRTEAGYIPFANDRLLQRFLRQNPGLKQNIVDRITSPLHGNLNPKFHMPPGRVLRPAQIDAMRKYIEAVL